MTPEEIIDNNKLIAKFMDNTFFIADLYDDFESKTGTEHQVRFGTMMVGAYWHKYSNSHNQDELCYHLHWDWIMPVVHRILFKTGFDDEGQNRIIAIRQALGNCEITELHETVVEFIKWHEGNKNILS